jgi:hypothetical protein
MLTPQVVHEGAVRVGEVEVVIDLVERGLARQSVLEVERADARFDFVRRGDGRRDTGGCLGVRGLSRAASENGYGDGTSQRCANESAFPSSHSSFHC